MVDPEIEVIKTFPVTAWKLMKSNPAGRSVRQPFVEANKSWQLRAQKTSLSSIQKPASYHPSSRAVLCSL